MFTICVYPCIYRERYKSVTCVYVCDEEEGGQVYELLGKQLRSYSDPKILDFNLSLQMHFDYHIFSVT